MIIFDFDGVLSDSFGILYKINKESADRVGISLSKKEYKSFFKGNIHKTRKILFKGDLEKSRRFSEARENFFSLYYTSENVKLFKFVPYLIKKLNKKTELFIVSSSPKKFVADILEKNKLISYFRGIIGVGVWGKRRIIQNYLGETKSIDCSYFVTDTVGDIKEAKGLGIKIVVVGWGFHSLGALRKFDPDFFVNNYNDLEKILL